MHYKVIFTEFLQYFSQLIYRMDLELETNSLTFIQDVTIYIKKKVIQTEKYNSNEKNIVNKKSILKGNKKINFN